jgi:hypothetical protein
MPLIRNLSLSQSKMILKASKRIGSGLSRRELDYCIRLIDLKALHLPILLEELL